jgi:hypothetical protein
VTEGFHSLAASEIEQFGLGFEVPTGSVSATINQVCAKLTIDYLTCDEGPVVAVSLREEFHCL